MAQGTGPRPVGASAGAGEAKETFPEFLRALWAPVGAEAAAAGGEGAGVGRGLGEERAEHGDTVPPPRGPRNPAVGSLSSPRMLLCSPADIPTAHVSPVGSRVVGNVRSAAESRPRCLLQLPPEQPKTPALQPGSHLHRLYGGEPYGARSGC